MTKAKEQLLSVEELKVEGYEFKTWEEASELFDFEFLKSRDRNRDLGRKVKNDYLFQTQREVKSKNQKGGAWLKKVHNTAHLYESNFRIDKASVLDVLTHFMCKNYHTFSLMKPEEIAKECQLEVRSTYNYISDLRDLGIIPQILPKVTIEVTNEWTKEKELRQVETNYCFYSYRDKNGIFHLTTKQMYGKQIRELIKYLVSEYGDHKLISSPNHYREAQNKFKERNGFLIEKSYDMRPNETIMKMYGYEITECHLKVEKDLKMIPFVIEEQKEEVEQPKLSVIVNESPNRKIAFGTALKLNFDAQILPSHNNDTTYYNGIIEVA